MAILICHYCYNERIVPQEGYDFFKELAKAAPDVTAFICSDCVDTQLPRMADLDEVKES